MKASILEAYEKGLRIIRSINKPEHYGPMQRWIIRFRQMYEIRRSPWDNKYLYIQSLEDELKKKLDEICDKNKKRKTKKTNKKNEKTNKTRSVRNEQ